MILEDAQTKTANRFNRHPLKAMDQPWLTFLPPFVKGGRGVLCLRDMSYDLDCDNVVANGDTEHVMLFDLNADLEGSIQKFREICVQYDMPTIKCAQSIQFAEEVGVAQEDVNAFMGRYERF